MIRIDTKQTWLSISKKNLAVTHKSRFNYLKDLTFQTRNHKISAVLRNENTNILASE